MRYLAGPITLSHTFYASDEETPLAVDSATVTVTDAFGVVAIEPSPASAGGEGAWTFDLAADAVERGVYMATWTTDAGITSVDIFEVVGGFLFTVPEARILDPDLADASRFPAEKIQQYREVVEAEFERITGRSFTPRTRLLKAYGDCSDTISPDVHDATAVRAADIDGTAQDISSWSVGPDGFIHSPTTLTDGSVVRVAVDYGFAAVPEDVRRVAVVRLRTLLAAEKSGIPDRATQFVATDGGQFTLATPGQGRWKTGIPEVDSVLQGYTFDLFDSVA